MTDTTLSSALLAPSRRPQVVDALVRLADTEIAGKKGISGTMLKTAYAGAKKAGEGRVHSAVDSALPLLARTLDPYYQSKGSTPFGAYLSDPARSGRVADELLAVADAKAAGVEGNPVGKVYRSMRGKAKDHVVAALPALGATLESFLAR
jgi:hypothetical protein